MKNSGDVLVSEGHAPSGYLAARTDRMILIADLETLKFGAPHIYMCVCVCVCVSMETANFCRPSYNTNDWGKKS